MAVAETARLIASYEFQNKGGAGAAAAARQLAGVEKAAGRTQGAFTRLGQGLKTGFGSLAKIGAAGAVVGLGLLAGAIKGGIAAQKELERVTAQTNAVIKSTRGVAGQSADAIAALANKYEDLNATMDNKVIQSGANVLLTFTKITKQGFEPALEAALNLNQAMGGGAGGLQGAIVLVGKALNDPVKGLAALGRVGVSFTAEQKALIKSLVSENKLLEAQQVILKELGTEFGGSFAAAGKTAEGTFASLGDAVEDLQLALVQGLMPGLLAVSRELTTLLKSEDFKKGAADLGKQIGGLFSADNIKGVKSFVSDVLPPLVDGLKLAGQATKTIVDLFRSLPPELQKAVVLGVVANKLTGGLVGAGIAGVVKGGVGAAIGGIRGATAATPVFTKEVGLPGTPGPGGGAGALAFGVIGVAAAAVAIQIMQGADFVGQRKELVDKFALTNAQALAAQLEKRGGLGALDRRSLEGALTAFRNAGTTYAQALAEAKTVLSRPLAQQAGAETMSYIASERAQNPIIAGFAALEDEAEASGKRIPGRLADGIVASRQAPVDAMDKVKALLASSMSETAQTTRLLGQLTSSELAAGLTDKDPAVRAASREARNTIINQLKDLGVTPGTLTKKGMDALILAMKNADPIIAAETTKIYNLVKGIVPTLETWTKAGAAAGAAYLASFAAAGGGLGPDGMPLIKTPKSPPKSTTPGTNTGGGIPNVGRSPLPTPAGPGEISGRPPHLTQVNVRVSTDHRQNSGAAAINNRYGKTPAEAGAI